MASKPRPVFVVRPPILIPRRPTPAVTPVDGKLQSTSTVITPPQQVSGTVDETKTTSSVSPPGGISITPPRKVIIPPRPIVRAVTPGRTSEVKVPTPVRVPPPIVRRSLPPRQIPATSPPLTEAKVEVKVETKSLPTPKRILPPPRQSAPPRARVEIKALPVPKPPVSTNSTDESEMSDENPVNLMEHQIEHVVTMKGILDRSFYAIDTSMMGSGKSHTTSYLLHEYGYSNIIMICPTSVEDNWRQMSILYNLPINHIISYESMCTRKGHQPKHGFLRRIELTKGAEFQVTPKFEKYVSEGCMLIADEFHHLKNGGTMQHAAFTAMASYINRWRDKSRVLLLSGTMIDKKEQVISLMKLLGIIRHHQMYVYHKEEGRLELRGAQEFLNYCMSLDPESTMQVISNKPFTQRNIVEVCFDLYVNVIQEHIASSMPPMNLKNKMDRRLHYLNMSKKGQEALYSAICNLHRATRYDSATGDYDRKNAEWGAITKALQNIELAETEIFIRKAREALEADPQCKVCIAFNFNDPLEMVRLALAEYNPLVATGKVNKKKRAPIWAAFNAHDTEHRVLLGNMHVIAEGINLDDTHGEFKRVVFASQNYHAIRSRQFENRFLRALTESDSVVTFVHGKCGKDKTSILNALARKSEVMKLTNEKQALQGILFPGEYPKITEEDPQEELQRPNFDEMKVSYDDLSVELPDVIVPIEEIGPISETLPIPEVEGPEVISDETQTTSGRTPSPQRGLRLSNFVTRTTIGTKGLPF